MNSAAAFGAILTGGLFQAAAQVTLQREIV